MRIKQRRAIKKIVLRIVVTAAILAAAVFILGFKVFVVKNVEVEGNELYSDKVIEKAILNDKYSWSSLYVFFKYRLKDAEPIPFIDTMEVSMKSPQTIQISVFEKGMLGYVYIESTGENAYFDKDGIVIEISSDVIDGVTEVKGLTIDKVKLYQKLPLQDESVLTTLLGVTQVLQKYDVTPDEVSVSDTGEVWLLFGDINVNLGKNTYLNEKVLRLQSLLQAPEIEGKKGVLRLDSWTPSSTDVYFSEEGTADSDTTGENADEPDTGEPDDAQENGGEDGNE